MEPIDSELGEPTSLSRKKPKLGATLQPLQTLEPTTTGYMAQTPVVDSPTPDSVAFEAQHKRKEGTSWDSYMGSMWRQDSITDGLMAHIAGKQLVPDPDYSVFAEKEWQERTAGVWPEYQKELADATSPAQAIYIQGQLMQKQEDLIRLGDMGMAGNTARFALGALSPENLAMGVVGGMVTKGVRAYKMAGAMNAAKGAVGQAEALAGFRAAEATTAASKGAVATGMASASAGNVAFEKLRQSVNFEDDSTLLVEAGIVGALFPLPFEIAAQRSASRLVAAASHEHSLMKMLAKADRGEVLTPMEHKALDGTLKAHEAVKAAERGEMSPEAARKALDEIMGPQLPDEMRWMKQKLAPEIEAHASRVMDELIPARVNERVRQQLGASDQLRLGHDPVVDAKGTPVRSTQTLTVSRDGSVLQPGQTTPSAGDILAAKAKAQITAEKGLTKAARASKALERIQATRKATMRASKEGAPKTPNEVLLGDKPVEAPVATVEAPKDATPAQPISSPVEAHQGPMMGETVRFTSKKTGEQIYGIREGIRESDGWHIIRDEDGTLHNIHPTRLEEMAPPEGFVPGGSAGSAQALPMGQGNVEQQLSRLNSDKLRWDYFAQLNRSKSEEVRSLVFSLVKDPLQVDNKVAQGMTASEWKSHYRRTVGGEFHRESRQAARDAAQAMGLKWWQRSDFNYEFHSLTTQLVRGDLTIEAAHPQIAPMLQKAAAAQRNTYAKMLKIMQEAGVKGADELTPNEFYVNRVWHHDNIRKAEEKHGRSAVLQVLANAINSPGLNGDVAKAGRFLDAVKKLEFANVAQNLHLGAKDMGTLRGELARYLGKAEIDTIVDTMFEAKEASGGDAGRMGNLKYRFDIAENMSMDTPAGVLKVADLFENDSRVLVDRYLNSTGGWAGLAKHYIHSEADWNARIKEIGDKSVEKGIPSDQVAKEAHMLQDLFSNIVGRPMSNHDFSTTARTAAALRGYTRSVSLGQLGLTAAFEMKQAIGIMGYRAFATQVPSIGKFFQAMRDGFIPDDMLARDIEHMVGFGSEMSSGYARAQEIEDGFLGQTLTRFESFANKASHATDLMSGNASFTSLTRQLSAKMATQRLTDFATGRKVLEPKMRERLVGWGIDDDRIDMVFNQLKAHAELNPQNGKVEGINWEKWSEDSQGTYQDFQTAISRMTRDAIQDHDIGETMPFMHSTLGKVFGELKSFFLVAHAKNMLKNFSYMDQTALQIWSIAFIGEAMAYSMQASFNFAGQPDKLHEMLSPEKIGLAAAFRSPVSGMLPFLINTGYQVGTGGESLVGPEMTSSGNGRTLMPPSAQAFGRLWALPSTGVGLLRDNGNVTRQEGADAWRSIPVIGSIYGGRAVGSYLSSTLPVKEVKH